MPSSFRSCFAILAAALLMTSVAFAFSAPLSDEAVREAYFLGQRRDDRTAELLETYRRYSPVPKSGPHVFVVELFTPYAQAVEASSKHSAGYSAQQASQDYKARGDSLRVEFATPLHTAPDSHIARIKFSVRRARGRIFRFG